MLEKLNTTRIFIGQTEDKVEIPIDEIISLLVLAILLYFVSKYIKKLLINILSKNLELGIRDAIASLISYGLAALFFIIIVQNILKIDLSALAFLGGAIGIGIGLGLQDLIKNFFSGLSFLLEGNVKIGNFIEIEGQEGEVEKISTRSTIIRKIDGTRIIIPNSQLVENKVTNWSYESPIKINIDIELDGDADIMLITTTILEAVYRENKVLKYPQPQVFYLGIGDSSLKFRVWVFIETSNLMQKEKIKSDLQFACEYYLRQKKIKPPTPHRIIWLREDKEYLKEQKENEHNSSLINLLTQVTYFKSFNEIELRQLIELGYHLTKKAGDFLFHQNEDGDAFYILLDGAVEVIINGDCKKVLPSGSFFGELSLLLSIPRTAGIKAQKDASFFCINCNNFAKLLQSRPNLKAEIDKQLEENKHKPEVIEAYNKAKAEGSSTSQNLLDWMKERFNDLFS